MSFWLPMGFDTADGSTPLPAQPYGAGGGSRLVGTADPVGMLQVFGDDDGTNVQEPPGSPELERVEQATFRHTFRTTYNNALALIEGLGRGTFVSDRGGRIWRILSSNITKGRAGYAELSVVAESISFDSPPDDFQIIPVELGINIIKHPRYFYALYPTAADFSTVVGSGGDITTVANVKQAIIRAIQTYQDSPFFPSSNTVNGLVQNNIILGITSGSIDAQVSGTTKTIDYTADASCLLAAAAAQEIIQKLWNQLDSPYLAGWQITWSQYYFSPPYLNPGSYIENPFGIVPDYFLSPSQNGSDSIFDFFADDNPQDFSITGDVGGAVDISWLRKADEIEYQRTWFKITRTWVGSPIGHWDAQIFSSGPRPSIPADYLPLAF